MKNFNRKFITLLSITFTLFISQAFAQLSLHINTSNNDVYFNNTAAYNLPIYDFNLVSSTPWSVTTTSGVVFSNFGCSNETFGDGTSAYMCYTYGGTWDANANGLYDLNGVPLYSDTYGGGIHNNYILIDYSSSDQANGVPLEPNVISGGGGTTSANPGNHHLAYMAPQTIEYIYAEVNMGNDMVSIPVYIDGQLLEQDCAGTWGGSLVNDACGVCDGDNSSCSGCVSGWATNYDPNATLDDGSCMLSGCTNQTSFNYNENATNDDGSCIAVILGCMEAAAVNYDANANTDNGMCQPYTQADVEAAVAAAEAAAATQITESYTNGFSEGAASVTPEDGIGQEDLESAYAEGIAYASPVLVDATLDLSEGWGMFGYTCINPVDAIVGFSSISDKIEIVKDEWGLSYLPAWEFNALGNLQFAKGYQIKMIEAVDSFHFCQTHALKVYGCIDEIAFNYNPVANTDDGSCVTVVMGCMDETAFNYNPDANTDGGSCVAVVMGCLDASAFNYNSDANTDDGSCVAVVMGCLDASAFNYNSDANTDDGSCVAVVMGCIDEYASNFNESANTDDGSCIPVVEVCYNNPGCGCDNPAPIEGLNCEGTALQIGDEIYGGMVFQINEDGSGLVVSMEDIEVMTWNDALSAAAASTTEGYEDWYLPNINQLGILYNTIGPGGDNSLGLVFQPGQYSSQWSFWSSSITPSNSNYVYLMSFIDGSLSENYYPSNWTYSSRAIRSF